MPRASLPIDTDVLSNAITVAYSPTAGVAIDFAFNEANAFALAPFSGYLHWVTGGEDNTILPAFRPLNDSIILRPVEPQLNPRMCYPFPRFVTFENLSKNAVNDEISTFRRTALSPPWDIYLLGDKERFFDGEGDYGMSLLAAVTSSQLTIRVAIGRLFNVGEHVRVNAELMEVVSIQGEFVGVLRAARGTTAAAHTSGTVVRRVAPLSIPVFDAGIRIGKADIRGARLGFTIRFWDKDDVRCPDGRELVYPHVYLHHLRFLETDIPTQNTLYDALPFGLSGPVGSGGGNAANDVLLLKSRLRDLRLSVRPSLTDADTAFTAMQIDSNSDATLEAIIRLFLGVVGGAETLNASQQITQRSAAERWLWAGNAPTWQKLETDIEHGYENIDQPNVATFPINPALNHTLTHPPNNQYERSGNIGNQEHDWGTNYLVSAIRNAGAHYVDNDNDLTENCRISNLVIRTNDASRPGGGRTPDHSGHETGLLVDLAFANRDGYSPGGMNVTNGGNSFTSYYQDYVYLVIRSFLTLAEVVEIRIRKTLPTDFADEDRVLHRLDHDDHVHVKIRPPLEAFPWDTDLENHI